MKKKFYRLFFDPTMRGLASRLLREHVWIYRYRFLVAFSFMVIAAAATAAFPYLLQPVFDDVFTNGRIESLVLLCSAVLLAFILKGFGSYGEAVTMSYVGQRIISDLQNRLFRHLMRADLTYFHNTSAGDLISRFTNDINLMRNAVATTLVGIGKDALTLILLVILMFKQDWILASIAFVLFPATVLPIAKIGRRMHKVTTHTQHEMSVFTTQLAQVFQGVRVVKAYGMEAYESRRAQELIDRLFSLIYKSVRVRSATHPIVESLGGVAVVSVLAYGGWQVMQETRTTGEFISFITAMLLIYEPLKRLSNLNANLQEGLAAARRVFEVIDTPPLIVDKPQAKNLPRVRGELELRHVSFHYGRGNETLQDISLSIPAGQRVALVGASGAGKSTLINLIARFYDVTEGAILMDGQDIRDVTLNSLRSQIALVSQEVILFDDEISNNIAYGNPHASQEDIMRAAKGAAASSFIEALPQGYETVVGENGVKLSGGQRQRLAIARAMLKDAPILLLDEATSSLDTDSERQIQTALHRLMKGRTTVMVAHRLSTVVDADMIYVLDQGRIMESGNHQQLMEQDGLYAKLWEAQSTHPIMMEAS